MSYWSYNSRKSCQSEVDSWIRGELDRLQERCKRPFKSIEELFGELRAGRVFEGSETKKKTEYGQSFGKKYPIGIYTVPLAGLDSQNYLKFRVMHDSVKRTDATNYIEVTLHIDGYYASVDIFEKKKYHEKDCNAGIIYDIVDAVPKLLEQLPQKLAFFEAKEHEAKVREEKREAVKKMQIASIDTWLEQICKSLTVPYAIEKGSIDYKLRVKISPKLQIVQYIPLKNFQEVMPTIADTIATYTALAEAQKAKVLVENVSANAKIRWRENEK
jgi:hypothetical protein